MCEREFIEGPVWSIKQVYTRPRAGEGISFDLRQPRASGVSLRALFAVIVTSRSVREKYRDYLERGPSAPPVAKTGTREFFVSGDAMTQTTAARPMRSESTRERRA